MKFSKILSDNMPVILTSASVVGVVSTTVLAVRATPLAYRDILDAKSEGFDPLSKMDAVKLTWKYYIPSALMGAITITSIVALSSLHSKRQAAIAGLYTLTDKAFNDYKDKVVEVIGEKKEEEVRDSVAKDQIDNDPVTSKQVVITGTGEHLCYDSASGRYFKSDIETIRKAVNDINETVLNDMYASQNDFYRLIGLKGTQYGDEVGWTISRKLEVDFSSHITDDGRPCISIGYGMEPMREYFKSKSW